MLLIIPTIQNTVNPTEKASLNLMTPLPNGLAMMSTPIPRAIASAARKS
jgi:hypothetical protein